mmetsp:Transcript_112160/g.311693  ORF Transcript_112160/g.311693 Transcript_112160/m.311693 type:complete len:146 (-) Transcript_112160:81-518(-)
MRDDGPTTLPRLETFSRSQERERERRMAAAPEGLVVGVIEDLRWLLRRRALHELPDAPHRGAGTAPASLRLSYPGMVESSTTCSPAGHEPSVASKNMTCFWSRIARTQPQTLLCWPVKGTPEYKTWTVITSRGIASTRGTDLKPR